MKLGPLELIIILIVVLLLFGPKNLPKLGSAIGQSMKNLREGLNSGKKEKADKQAKAATDAPAAQEEPQAATQTEAFKDEAPAEEAELVVEGKPAPKSQQSGPYDA